MSFAPGLRGGDPVRLLTDIRQPVEFVHCKQKALDDRIRTFGIHRARSTNLCRASTPCLPAACAEENIVDSVHVHSGCHLGDPLISLKVSNRDFFRIYPNEHGQRCKYGSRIPCHWAGRKKPSKFKLQGSDIIRSKHFNDMMRLHMVLFWKAYFIVHQSSFSSQS